MGIKRDDGYSASVEAYLRVGDRRYSVAKTADDLLFIDEPCELAPGTEGTLVVIVDGEKYVRTIVFKDGIVKDRCEASYAVTAPF